MRHSTVFAIAALAVSLAAGAAEAKDCTTTRCKSGYTCVMKGTTPKCVVAPQITAIEFTADYRSSVKGALKAGQPFTVTYSPSRAKITASHGASPCWGIQGYLKFNPGGGVQEFKAIDFENVYGTTTNKPIQVPSKFTVPAGARSAELWFKNWTACDNPKEVWDSNYGKNYVFAVK